MLAKLILDRSSGEGDGHLRLLFTPIQIGSMPLENRVMMGSMHLGFEGRQDGEDSFVQFYQERLKKRGPALIVTGGISVSIEGEGGAHFLGFYREQDCNVMKKLVDGVHQFNGKMAAQLFHAGRYSYPELTGYESVAPSALRSPIHRHTPRALTEEEIIGLIETYGQCAIMAKELGFDAIEIMGSEGYLINQFLSPVTNKREDAWGGDVERRMRFALEVIHSIRRHVGKEYPVLFRLSGADLIDNSTTEEETIEFAKRVGAAGVDAINIGIGWHESKVPTISMMVPRAGFIRVAERIKEQVNIPVIGSNRINDPQLAEELLSKQYCDMVSMARPFLADPHLLHKAYKKEFESVNTCIACNQACLDHVFEGKFASCLVNPRAGRESRWNFTTTSGMKKKKVLVIGGGPAGLEAARALAERGEAVHLYEAKSDIGGQLNYARQIPDKQEFEETLRYYKHELSRLGVTIHYNSRATKERIRSLQPDLVVMATGVKPRIPAIPGVELPQVYHYQQVFDEEINIGKDVVIIGAGGVGCDIAHYLLKHGDYSVTLLRRKGKIGEGLGKTTRWALIRHLFQQGMTFLNDLSYDQITEDGVLISQQTENGVEQKLIPADAVILAAGQEPAVVEDILELEKEGIPVLTIGGARVAGELDAKRAIYEGAKIAYE